ncbi:MAG: cysteine desulfurase [Ruminococcus sp.]|nr:cysteine desulfurase [Ruminococcus sp.]
MIYLDNAATTMPCETALAAAAKANTEVFCNPSSLYRAGLDAENLITSARESVASALSVPAERIFFTSGATEANNLALRGVFEANRKRRPRIVISAVEHASVYETARFLESEYGAEVVDIPTNSKGEYDPDDIVSSCDERTCLVSMMTVNNETGNILPTGRVFSQLKRRFPDIITHTDAVSSFMKIKMKAADISADMITVSGHKIRSVKGCGALYIKKGVKLIPQICGGGQESGMRSGTENVPAIYAFGETVKAEKAGIDTAYKNAEILIGGFAEKLKTLPYIAINSAEERSPYILNFSVSGIRSEIMLHFLESKGILVSSGSACSKGAISEVLENFRVPKQNIDSAIRVSLSRTSVPGDLEALFYALREGYSSLRRS